MKKLMKILPVVIMICLVLVNVYAVGVPDSSIIGNNQGSTEVKAKAQKIWGTVATIVQFLAVAAVVFAGVRYMFAGADQKADIKKGLGILAVGAILVFAATTILKTFADVLK